MDRNSKCWYTTCSSILGGEKECRLRMHDSSKRVLWAMGIQNSICLLFQLFKPCRDAKTTDLRAKARAWNWKRTYHYQSSKRGLEKFVPILLSHFLCVTWFASNFMPELHKFRTWNYFLGHKDVSCFSKMNSGGCTNLHASKKKTQFLRITFLVAFYFSRSILIIEYLLGWGKHDGEFEFEIPTLAELTWQTQLALFLVAKIELPNWT